MSDGGCEVWPTDAGPCGAPEVERLFFLNEWMDHPGDGLGLCGAHLAEYLADSLLAPGR